MQIVAGVQGALTGDPHVLEIVAVELRTYLGCVPKEVTKASRSATKAIG